MWSMTGRPRLAQIDLLKGAAILSVIAIHGLARHELRDGWAGLWFGQAVPVFLVLMAVNASQQMRRANASRLRDLYSRAYFAGRVERLLRPFAVVWLAALAIGAVHGGLHFGPLMLTGVIPLRGPGNYFVTIAFEFVVVFPALWWAFQRAPGVTIAGAFALDAAFELVAPSVFHGAYPYGYDAAILRYLGQVVLGLWIVSHPRIGERGNRWILALGAVGVAYEVVLHVDRGLFTWLRLDFGTSTNFIAAAYAVVLVLAGLRFLPSEVRRLPAVALAELGRASWHIFLVQIVWFAVVHLRGAEALPLHMLGAGAIGYALYRVMSRPRRAAGSEPTARTRGRPRSGRSARSPARSS
jgi:peptidoglycan/LPS O-acetylase OafA/YrhL